MKGKAVLFSEMTPPAEAERAFNAWCDDHYTPDRVDRVPGILSAMRYKSKAGPHYLSIYELESPASLDGADCRRHESAAADETRQMLDSVSGVTRYIAAEAACAAREGAGSEPLDAGVVLCVLFNVPMERAGAFEDWFDGEHAPMLLQCEDWLMTRRLDVVAWDPEPCSHMILHYLNHEAALETAALARPNATGRGSGLAAEPWFAPSSVVYHRRRKRFVKSG